MDIWNVWGELHYKGPIIPSGFSGILQVHIVIRFPYCPGLKLSTGFYRNKFYNLILMLSTGSSGIQRYNNILTSIRSLLHPFIFILPFFSFFLYCFLSFFIYLFIYLFLCVRVLLVLLLLLFSVFFMFLFLFLFFSLTCSCSTSSSFSSSFIPCLSVLFTVHCILYHHQVGAGGWFEQLIQLVM